MAYKRPRPPSPSNASKRSRGGVASTNYVALGTELPPEEGRDDGEFMPVWQQTVTDEQGRRRLHGAFTGGFSAGYFNTVGSKEGWTPKAFVSSRSNRAKDQPKAATQRAEDFMDEEDLAQAAESRQLETAQSFAGIGTSGDTSNKDGFFGLFVTEDETMGTKIAQKMGWRRDQGVGRKVRRKVQGDRTAHMFAPRDSRMMTFSPDEVNRRGLGYQSEARLDRDKKNEPATATSSRLHYLEEPKEAKLNKKPAPKKSSFGVGVLNDTGSDDEDPYELGPKITFNKTIGKDKKVKKPSKFAKAGVGERPVLIKKKATAKPTACLVRTSYDGKPPLKGFIIVNDSTDLTTKPKFTPPPIPPGWKSSKSNGPATEAPKFQSVADAAKASTLDSGSRADILGEQPLPSRSVFDFIPKEARDRLAALTGKSNLPQGLGQSAPEGHVPSNKPHPKDLWSFVPILDKSIAAAALAKGATGWMPYTEDPAKRARYIDFLELRCGQTSNLPTRPADMTVADWAKELQEFAHAAEVFKPSTGLMASRFTSSSTSSSTGTNNSNHTGDLLSKPPPKPADPAEEAAKMGMHGAMTRSSFAFYPSRLLCKRFNVKPPPEMPHNDDSESGKFGGGAATRSGKAEEPVGKAAMDKMVHEVLTKGPGMGMQRPMWMNAMPEPRSEGGGDASGGSKAREEEGYAAVDTERNAALEQPRAGEEVFKAIFGDDDDEDEDGDE